ncbi:ABC transporter substrate-binding protein [Microbacterium suaedae]|uniref:ABC transporter substrate-binding protein n=1 Tax=Microbacterium suaedae TaxID=2067813 RepID=UPI0013A61A3A|nr:ABC transporter substrate-binding protein [Microbacterium suaedae]
MSTKNALRGVAMTIGAALLATTTTACASDDGAVDVVIGYQSETINTVTAGSLLRSRGYFEQALADETSKTGVRYNVTWEDYDTGAPITAQMLAGKIDIGSMGDFPLVLNASRTYADAEARTELIATTAFNISGGLNGIVVPSDSDVSSFEELRNAAISTSVGSAGDGLLDQTIDGAGLQPSDVNRQNQAPSVGATSLKAGSVQAYSQFAPWPAQVVWNENGRLLVDGATTGNPTFHGVVVRQKYAEAQPAVVQAFIKGMSDATDYLHANPLAASREVAATTGLPLEVVYLYNGPYGIANFNMALKPSLVAALQTDAEYLRQTDRITDGHLSSFANETYVKQLFGSDYQAMVTSEVNLAASEPVEEGCTAPLGTDAAPSAVLWSDEDKTSFYATPECLLSATSSADAPFRAAYISDGLTGTRWFAEKSEWVYDPGAPAGARWAAFATAENASTYRSTRPGSRQFSFEEAQQRSQDNG